MHFAQPGWLWLLVLMPLPWLLERARPRIALARASMGFRARHRIGWIWLARPCRAVLRGLAIGCLAVALARPQTVGGGDLDRRARALRSSSHWTIARA